MQYVWIVDDAYQYEAGGGFVSVHKTRKGAIEAAKKHFGKGLADATESTDDDGNVWWGSMGYSVGVRRHEVQE
jgi:beta-xylosidase